MNTVTGDQKTPPVKKRRKGRREVRGRPRTLDERDPKDLHRELTGLGFIGATDAEAAAVLGVSVPTLWRFLKRNPEAKAIWDDAPKQGQVSLRRKQHQIALAGNVAMLKFLGKNRLGQKEKTELTGAENGPLVVNVVRFSDD